jgi:hypothetical protein
MLLLIVAGASKGVSDIISHHFSSSIFSNEKKYKVTFWNPLKKNKWKDKKVQGKLVERYPGSSTIFVGFTDAWHCFNTIRHWSLSLVITIQTQVPILYVLFDNKHLNLFVHKLAVFTIVISLFLGSFVLFYNRILELPREVESPN